MILDDLKEKAEKLRSDIKGSIRLIAYYLPKTNTPPFIRHSENPSES